MRLDLTQNQLYTLSPGTQAGARRTQGADQSVFLFLARVGREAVASAHALCEQGPGVPRGDHGALGRQDSSSGDRPAALLRGRGPCRRGGLAIASGRRGGGESLYFGLAGTNSTDGRSVIPSFQPDREEFLEYDVAKLIQELANPKKPVIGLMSSIAHARPVQSHDRPDGRPLARCCRSSNSYSPCAP